MTKRTCWFGNSFLFIGIAIGIISILGLIVSSDSAFAKDRPNIKEMKFDKDWSYYTRREMDSYNIQRQYEQKNSAIFALQQAKRGIINGDLALAKFFLNKISDRRSTLVPVKKRYLSIIKFIEGKYRESYDLVKGSDFNSYSQYREICLLRIINLIALDDPQALKSEVAGCQNLTIEYSNTEQFWLNQMARIKENNQALLKGNLIENLRNVLNSTEFTEIWMKMALFLNKEDVILKYVGQLPSSAFRSKIIRELIGFAHYRAGNIKQALEFIEDIESPNADNIRGNINLEQKKYELAFGHFKLALKKKQNSQNALERGIPLSYILGQWDEGISMLKRLVGVNLNLKRKSTLETLFHIRKKDFKKARSNLLYLEQKYTRNFPREVNLMDSYISLMEGDNQRLELASGR
ncbi:MAG: hypothetical protein NXH75_15020, partial [Halobacteriovoraceae bacterium]|nr:hypothetical protein [Halobacteriovoraceae bacterium]